MLLLALVLGGVPVAPATPPPLPTIAAPLGNVTNLVETPVGGAHVEDRPVAVKAEGCSEQVVYLMRSLAGTARAVEQLQQWLDQTAELEKRLFAKKGQLGEVVKQLAGARLEPKKLCTAPALKQGYQLGLDAAPKKLCAAEPGQAVGDWWFFTKARPAAVVNVSLGAPDLCKPRLSTVLFDARGNARLRFHADWAGAVSATLLGDRCQSVEFAFDQPSVAFVPTMKVDRARGCRPL